jgi:DNA-binding transcriptional LysR family regulator
MQLKQIETFYWAARLGSFARAARHVHMTTSTVSMRIQELEGRLGVLLFDRSHRRVRLTPEGLQLLPLAEQMLTTSDRILKTVARSGAISGYVRLGVAEVVALGWLPTLISELRIRFPDIQTEIEVALSYVLEDKLDAGMLDMALAPCQLTPARFAHTSLGGEDFRWMCSPALTGVPETVTPAEFMELPLIVTSREQQLRGSILRWINENRISFRKPTICNTFTIAGKMAIAGMGCAFLPVRLYHDHLRRRELRLVECRPRIERLEHFVVRPLAEGNPVHDAVESLAVTVARLADPDVSLSPPHVVEARRGNSTSGAEQATQVQSS